ncbi:MAG: TolC family outer membrane protein [Magnetococcales bacterium]|nr:TolC family outer membrane protein [Magnetococcales bacterium]
MMSPQWLRRFWCLLAMLFLWPTPALSGPHQGFFSALHMALNHNEQVRESWARYKGAEEGIIQTRAGLLPTVTLDSTASYTASKWDGGDSDAQPTAVKMSLSNTLFDMGVYEKLSASHLLPTAAEQDLMSAIQSVFFQVAQQTNNLLKSREMAHWARKNLQVTEQHAAATRTRFTVGELTQTDMRQAEARLASTRAALIHAENSVRIHEAAFLELVGAPPPLHLSLPPLPKGLIQQVMLSPPEKGLKRPDLHAAQLRLESAISNVDVQKAGHLPTLSLSSSAGRTWTASSSTSPSDAATVGLSLSVPLYQGGRTASKVRQAVWGRDEKRSTVERLRKQVVREVQQAVLDLQSAMAAQSALAYSERAAREAMQGVNREFQVGTRSSIDLLGAQDQLFTAQEALVNGRYRILLAQYQLLKAKGRLSLADPVFKVLMRQNHPKYSGGVAPDARAYAPYLGFQNQPIFVPLDQQKGQPLPMAATPQGVSDLTTATTGPISPVPGVAPMPKQPPGPPVSWKSLPPAPDPARVTKSPTVPTRQGSWKPAASTQEKKPWKPKLPVKKAGWKPTVSTSPLLSRPQVTMSPRAANSTVPPNVTQPTMAPRPVRMAAPASASGAQSPQVFLAGSFADPGNANNMIVRLKHKGLPVFQEQAMIQGRPYLRVMVGPFTRQDSLQEAQRRLSMLPFMPRPLRVKAYKPAS